MTAWRAGALALLATFGAAGPLAAQPLPALSAPVNDFANVIDAATEAELDRRIRALQGASGDVVVIATVETFAPFSSIEEFAVRLFEQAGIGEGQRDNGVLIVLARNERKVRIEVGYGLEEFITDGFSGETIRQAMLPAFREGRYGQGLLDGTTRIIQRIAERRGVTLSEIPPPAPARETPEPGLPGAAILVAVIVLMMILRRVTRVTQPWIGPPGRRRDTWSGWHGGIGGFGGGGFGGGGGGFGGFGGGRSGGGGASGGW